MFSKQDQQAVNTIRVLSAEGIQKANSGHPGLPLGSAPMAYELWANHMNHNPKDPTWINRDRFILSAGHGSMLLYSLLHLFGYGVSIDDLKNFRQWGSKTPGHPEYGHTVGVEATTGPLGQGISMAVGMAMAEEHLASQVNCEGYPVIDHYTFALVGDGCLMEGVSSEASSFAGTQKLGKLIVLYDDNNITIEGDTSIAFTEDVSKRYEAYGWQVLRVSDGNDLDAIGSAIKKAKKNKDRPTLIMVKTIIGYGSPTQGSAKTHGEPLGEDNIAKLKDNLGLSGNKPFEVPLEVSKHYEKLQKKLEKEYDKWQKMFVEYQTSHPIYYKELMALLSTEVPDLLDDRDFWAFDDKPQATRATSGTMLNRLNERLPNLFGGSADLAPSNKTELKNAGWFAPDDRRGKNIHFGVREFAMACMANGMALHGGVRPFCATFFVFSDYQKAAIRLSACMQLPVMYVFTHDSIGVGEDGPTHQPIEQLSMLRAIPNVTVFRPADGHETAAAYCAALSRKGPTCIISTRQNLPSYENSGQQALKGGYVFQDCDGTPDVILIATGSEVSIAMDACKQLSEEGTKVRVVSMPSLEVFEEQTPEYKENVLPKNVVARVAIEAASTMPWYRYVGLKGAVVGLDHFGASGPSDVLFKEFNITASHLCEVAKDVMKRA